MDVRVGIHRKLSTEELMLLNLILEKTFKSPLDCMEIQPVHPKGNQSWIFIKRTDAEAETPILWLPDVKNWLPGKDPLCWERLKTGEGDDWGWDAWMASPIQWTWVWASFGSWWWTGKPGVLQSMASQSVGHNWTTELNWTDCQYYSECAAHCCLVHLVTSWKINMEWTTRIDFLQKICLRILLLSLRMLSIYAWN